MRCINCIKEKSHQCYTDNITHYFCNICEQNKMSGSWYNPAYCCEDCSDSNRVCQDCWSKDIVSYEFSNIYQPYDEKDTIIFYHENCDDWIGWAYSAYKYLWNKASYVPLTYWNYFPVEHFKNKTIYFIDFSLCYNDTVELMKNNTVYVIDHHKTALENLWTLENCFFDMNHSGAYLAHKYFFPKDKVPEFILYIEDSDLFKFELDNTKDFSAWFNIVWKDFYTLSILDENKKALKGVIDEWKTINAYLDTIYNDLLKKAYPIVLNGVEWTAINATWQFASVLWNRLAARNWTFWAIWYVENNRIKCSLRSVWDFDVSLIAKLYNGGWHRNASAFTLDKTSDIFNETLLQLSQNL